MSGRCIISNLEKKSGIKTMDDTCRDDDECVNKKINKDVPYASSFLKFNPKLCMHEDNYIKGGKYKKSKRQSKKHRQSKKSRKSRKHRRKSKRHSRR